MDDLMLLCKADVTSKNHSKVKRFLKNFDYVYQKIQDVEERDHVKNFQPPIDGEYIMEFFGLKPSKKIGEIKDEIKEAILEGKIKNNFEEAFELMKEIGNTIGLNENKKQRNI